MSVNLVPNPRFLEGLALWYDVYGDAPTDPPFAHVATLPVVHPVPLITTALRYTPQSYNPAEYQGVRTPLLPVTAGSHWWLSTYVLGQGSTAGAVYVKATFFKADQSAHAAEVQGSATTLSIGSWERHSLDIDLTTAARADVAYVQAYLYGAKVTPCQLYYSGVMVSEGDELGPYRDGDWPGWDWDGDAHESSSEGTDPASRWTTASLSIDGGAASTYDSDVVLTIEVTDADGLHPDEMRFTEDGATFTAWVPYATSANYILSPRTSTASEVKTVYMQVR